MFRSHAVRQVTFVLASLAAVLVTSIAAAAEQPQPAATLTGKAGGLTSDEVARRATATSLSAEEKRHDVASAKAQLDKAFADYFPRLSFSGSYARLSPITNPSLGTMVLAPGAAEGPIPAGQTLVAAPLSFKSLESSTSLSATLNVPLSDYVFRLVQAHDGAKAQVASAERSLKATERKAAYDARALYYDWAKSELETAVAAQNLELGREHLARVKALAAADSASEADVARVEATVAESELVLVQAKNLAALQHERIEIAMHETAHRTYEIGEDLRSAPAAPDAPVATADLDALVRSAQRDRPEIAAVASQVTAYEKDAAVARSKGLPRLDAFAQTTTANPSSRHLPQQQEFNTTWQVGVQLTYAPNDTATGLSLAAASQAKADGADAHRRALLDAVRTEVTEAVLAHRNAIASVDTSARRLAAAETSYRARRERFLAEKATTVELTEAQTELFRARLDAVQAQIAIRVARARVAYATGK
jgi:outer membrane protein TolC